ncbi:MAG: hypothetical protein KJ077_36660 [Anaerolineae bacterium]|nr:hypothetical protein [Anaerolineae bacterium]
MNMAASKIVFYKDGPMGIPLDGLPPQPDISQPEEMANLGNEVGSGAGNNLAWGEREGGSAADEGVTSLGRLTSTITPTAVV